MIFFLFIQMIFFKHFQIELAYKKMFFYRWRKGGYMRLASLFIVFFLTSCSWSVIMTHTDGTASDVGYENQTTSPEVKSDLQVPLKP